MNESILETFLTWLVTYFDWLLYLLSIPVNLIRQMVGALISSLYHANKPWFIFCAVLFIVLEILNFVMAHLFRKYIKSHSSIYKEILRTNYNYPFYELPTEFHFSKIVASSQALGNTNIEKFAKEQLDEPSSKLTLCFETAALNRFQLDSYVKSLKKIQQPLLSSSFPYPFNFIFGGLEKEIYTNAMAYPTVNPKYYLSVKYDSPGGRVHRTKESWCDQEYMEKIYKKAKKIPEYKPISAVEKLFRKEADEKAFKLGYISELPDEPNFNRSYQEQSSGISPKMRYDVMMRDQQQCVRCGKTAANGVTLDVYHKISVASGGQNTMSNLCTLCDSCAMELNIPRKKARVRKVNLVSDEFKAAQRARMTPAYKESILRRDGYRCQICGKTLQDGVRLEVDHIKPVALGGTSDSYNLRTLCFECNRGKGKTYNPAGMN